MYAVVIFVKESDEKYKSIQEVPVSWLSKDKKSCRWPPRNSHIYIAKNAPPQDDWPWHPVEIELICDTLKEAKKKKSKRGHDRRGSTRQRSRAPKPKVYFSPDTSVPKTTFLKDHPYSFRNTKFIFCGFSRTSLHSQNNAECGINTLGHDKENLLTEIGKVSDTVENYAQPSSEASWSGNEGSSDPLTSQLEKKIDKILEILSEHKLILQELLQNHQIVKSPVPLTKFGLPLKTLEEINDLEEKLKEKPVVAAFIDNLKSVRGSGGKDFVNRSLKAVFTNQVGELCSWTGAKNYFKISNLKLTASLYYVVHTKYGISQRDFEFHVRDWLRNAKQRRQREEAKEKSDSFFFTSLPLE